MKPQFSIPTSPAFEWPAHSPSIAATKMGDTEIEQAIILPSTCVAPIVLVRGSFTGTPVPVAHLQGKMGYGDLLA